MDQSANFIRQVAPGLRAEYADEFRDGGTKLKQEIMAKVKHELRGQLDPALDKIIKRKVEDFEFGIIEGRAMNATTSNTRSISSAQTSPTPLCKSLNLERTPSRRTLLKNFKK